MGDKKFIGTLPQKELLKLYAKHVNGPKVKLFKGFGFNVIPGEREGIKFKILERSKELGPPLEIINCRSSGGVFNLGHRNPRIIQFVKDALDELDLGDHMILSEWRAIYFGQRAVNLPFGLEISPCWLSRSNPYRKSGTGLAILT